MIPKILCREKTLRTGNGSVILASALQGRIFAEMDGELLHRFDNDTAEHPSPDFNNLGGNSLWPAPEGGLFAFNYPSDGGPWHVQDGINRANSALLPDERGMYREINLENRTGTRFDVCHRREIFFPDYGYGAEFGLREVVYASNDSLTLKHPLPDSKVLIAAWSLEQFDLTPNAFAFGKVRAGAVNSAFYGDPEPYLQRNGDTVVFYFNAPEKLQIGLPESAAPELIGAVIPERDLLILRKIRSVRSGVRIDIADNEQKNGPYGAQDEYSVFYGAGAKFFELETIAPVCVEQGVVTGSELETETHFYRGTRKQFRALLSQKFNMNLEEL